MKKCFQFKILLIVLALLILGVSGCQPAPQSVKATGTAIAAVPTETPEPGVTLSLMITASNASTKSTIEPTQPFPSITHTVDPSATIKATEETLPIQNVRQHCINVQPSLPQAFLTEGIILLEEFGNISETDLSTLQSNSVTPAPLLNMPPFLGGERSLGKLAFMYGSTEPDLVIITPNGDVLTSFEWDDRWESYSLIDDQRILFRYKGSDPVAEITNPYTDTRQMYSPYLPKFFDGYLDAHITYWKFVYHPNLTTVAYMQLDQDAKFPGFVLWDLDQSQALWTLDKNSVYFVPPVWSPDATTLAVVAMNQKEDNWDRFELFLVDLNGNATQWIDMKGSYQDVLITDMKWSPDSRYIAFLAPSDKPFLVLDTSTQQLYDYCIPGNSSYGRIVWSPDSTQVIVPQKDAPAIVIDLVKETATQITETFSYRPVGWLISPP